MRGVILLALFVLSLFAATADEWRAPILPAPDPFSLNSYDAISAVLMIRRVPALLRLRSDGSRDIVPVRSARSVWVDYDPHAYEGHQHRYDILLNGEPLDWDSTYIEYAGSMVNLRVLFTYRNQRPVPETTYRTGP